MDTSSLTDGTSATNVVPLHVPAAEPEAAPKHTRAAEKKWGREVMACGFCIAPSLLLLAQRRLHLKPPQLVVLLHLMDIWWGDQDDLPWPSKRHLADRIGMGQRRVQSIVAELEQAGLVRRIERRDRFGGKTSNAHDLSGLVERLREIAPDELAAREKLQEKRGLARRPGLRRRRDANGAA